MTLFLGSVTKGSKRWLSFGPLSFQPSELSKLVLILFLAGFLSNYEKKSLIDLKITETIKEFKLQNVTDCYLFMTGDMCSSSRRFCGTLSSRMEQRPLRKAQGA